MMLRMRLNFWRALAESRGRLAQQWEATSRKWEANYFDAWWINMELTEKGWKA